MASELSSGKPVTTEPKPPRDARTSPQTSPHIQSPLANHGPELIRDSHC